MLFLTVKLIEKTLPDLMVILTRVSRNKDTKIE